MAGNISRETIDQVRQACDIVELIGSYVPLKRAGRQYKALSPFKKEKTPSFFVDPDRQMFKCFSTGHGGDVFKFVQLYENLEFPSAVRQVARRVGIVIPDSEGPSEDRGAGELRERMMQLHSAVAGWWAQLLRADPSAETARSYLKTRQMDPEMIREFGIGYAPADWEATIKWASLKGFDAALMEKSGLATRNDSGRVYDRFRGRLMFPICDDQGRVVAFSGRLLDAEAKAAKYVNSPETEIFSKSRILFGLHKSKRAIAEVRQAILCEGQIDLIRCYEKGIKNIVASQGTAFTDHHARLLKRFADEVVVCYDADGAGQDAAARSIDLLIGAGLTVRIATLPQGEDPDTLLRGRDASVMLKLLAAAPEYWRHLLDRACRQHDISTPRGRGAIAAAMAPVVLSIVSPTQKEMVLRSVATQLGVTMDVFEREMQGVKKTAPSRFDEFSESSVTVEKVEEIKVAPVVDHLLALCLQHPRIVPELQRQFPMEWLDGVAGGEILIRLFEAHANEEWVDSSEFSATSTPAEQNYLSGIPFRMDILLEPLKQLNPVDYGKILMETLKSNHKKRRISLLEQEMKIPGVDPVRLSECAKELLELKRSQG